MGPAHELMQAAKPCDALGAWPQHQVIDIAEQYIGAGGAHLLDELDVAVTVDGRTATEVVDAVDELLDDLLGVGPGPGAAQ